jgi:hypothetical protein
MDATRARVSAAVAAHLKAIAKSVRPANPVWVRWSSRGPNTNPLGNPNFEAGQGCMRSAQMAHLLNHAQ